MNERINGLWWKARIGYNNQSCDPEVMERFAELIVAECADIAYQSLYEDRVFDDVPANIRRNVMDAIKQHFGIEK